MFTVDKKEIGQHIADLISESRFKSARQFGIEYLKVRYGSVNVDAISNIQNRICQISKGNKWIQIEDLPIFAELLEVSIENIISAGNFSPKASNHVTNYSIAHSNNPEVWKDYIQRKDKLVLNPDEYNKTVIDYALEAGNYPFLKYLIDSNYIWFVGDNKQEYHESFGKYGACFGAGTSIKRRDSGYIDNLEIWLKDKDDLRFRLMSLAIKNKDFDMLDCMHAREVPMLYKLSHLYMWHPHEYKLPQSKNTNQFINSLASCTNTTLSYFFEPFTIEHNYRNEKNTFIFPYAGMLLEQMIKQKKHNASLFISKAIKYNKDVLNLLNNAIDDSIKACNAYYERLNHHNVYNEQFIKAEAMRDLYLYPETDFVSFTSPRLIGTEAIKGFITNIIHVNVKSYDPEVQFLINELNDTYESIHKLYIEKEAKHV